MIHFEEECGYAFQCCLSAQKKHVVFSVLKILGDKADQVRCTRFSVRHCLNECASSRYHNANQISLTNYVTI